MSDSAGRPRLRRCSPAGTRPRSRCDSTNVWTTSPYVAIDEPARPCRTRPRRRSARAPRARRAAPPGGTPPSRPGTRSEMSFTPSPCTRANSPISRVAPERAREHEADLALLEHVARAVANAGLRARVGDAVEAERVLVVVRRLLRVADPQLDVVPAVQRHEVLAHAARSVLRGRPGHVGCGGGQSPDGSGTAACRSQHDARSDRDRADDLPAVQVLAQDARARRGRRRTAACWRRAKPATGRRGRSP